MKWSQFNHIFISEKYGDFIYNTTTNSFVRISPELYNKIKTTKNWDSEISYFPSDFVDVLLSHRIIVEDNFDLEFINKIKYLKYVRSFNTNTLQLTVATTTNCNFKCPYCFEGGIDPINMSRRTENALIDFISKRESVAIVWYGGEPLLNFGAIQRISEALAKKSSVSKVTYGMITNGYYMTEEVCSFLKNYNYQAIQITLDGMEETHNRSRISKNGEPSFRKIVDNIDSASKIMPECRFSIRVNIGFETKEEYPVLYKALKQRWKGRKNISIYLSFIEDYKKCNLTPFSSSAKMNFVKELMQKHNIIENTMPRYTTSICSANSKDSFIVSADGRLYKCLNDIGKDNKAVGSVLKPDKLYNYGLLTEYSLVLDKFNDEKCLNCFLLPACHGGCPLFRYENRYENGTHDICPYQNANLDDLMEMMYELYAQRNKTNLKN